MSTQSAIGATFSYDIPRLLQLFEGLGENCDFGVVQRAIGIEPLGLFRFAACKALDVAALLRTRFDVLGEPGDLWLDEVGPRREYWVKSRRYSFEAHTDRYGGVDDREVSLAAQAEKIGYLKNRLMRDLSGARKLFVFKGRADRAAMLEIATQLQTYGPNHLLWVDVADGRHPAGTVERVADGILLGFVSHFGTYDGDPSLPVENWILVCANAYRLWRNADPPQTLLENLVTQTMAAGSCRWFADPGAVTRILNEDGPIGGAIFEHSLETPDATAVYRAHLPVDSGGNFVLSAWVRIPEGIHGRQIAMLLPGFSSIAMWTADLKSRTRWQRIWVTASLPPDARQISCEIIAECAVGTVFHSASWCLERGSRPLGFGFVL